MGSPAQKPKKPFPAWYLRRGTINAADAELESSIDACEWWEWFGGGLVVVGVAAAVAIAAIHPKYDSFLEQWGSAIADGLVAIGVAIEIKFGQMAGLRQGELQKRSKDKLGDAVNQLADANNRLADIELELAYARESAAMATERAAVAEQKAAEAALALTDFRARRRLSPDDMKRIAELLKPFSPMTFDVSISMSDQEFLGLVDLIGVTAIWGEWAWLSMPAGVMYGAALIGVGGSFLNVEIASAFDAPQNVKDAAETCASGLAAAGVAASSRMLNARAIGGATSRAQIHIRIGRKT